MGDIEKPNAEAIIPGRFEVQRLCPIEGWSTWLSYDEKEDAEWECTRRGYIYYARARDNTRWRVIDRLSTE